MIGWKTCREAAELVSQGLDRELGLGERVALRVHLSICKGCTRFSRQMQLLRAALARLPDEEPEARPGAQST